MVSWMFALCCWCWFLLGYPSSVSFVGGQFNECGSFFVRIKTFYRVVWWMSERFLDILCNINHNLVEEKTIRIASIRIFIHSVDT